MTERFDPVRVAMDKGSDPTVHLESGSQRAATGTPVRPEGSVRLEQEHVRGTKGQDGVLVAGGRLGVADALESG